MWVFDVLSFKLRNCRIVTNRQSTIHCVHKQTIMNRTVITLLASTLPRLAPALPSSVTLDDKEHGDQSHSSADSDDAEAAHSVAGT